MPSSVPGTPTLLRHVRKIGAVAVVLGAASAVWAQSPAPSNASAPASIPAGADAPLPTPAKSTHAAEAGVSPKALRDAEDAYVRGARALDKDDLVTAEREFAHANELNPQNRDYDLALAVTREHRLTDLVQRAARAEKLGRNAEASDLLEQARKLDPDNAIVRQHFEPDGQLLPFAGPQSAASAAAVLRAADASTLGGPIVLQPAAGVRTFHTRGNAQTVLTALCDAFGLKARFDPALDQIGFVRFDLQDATFDQASRLAGNLTHTFAVPLQPGTVFFAKDTAENRNQYLPLIEETIFIPGVTADNLTEYANMARNVFNLKVVSAVGSSSGLVLRGDQETLDRVNATFDDLVDSGAEVLLDLTLYEVDKSRTVSLGAATPSSVGVFPVAATAENLITANQSLISAAIASGALVLTSNPYTNAIEELGLLLASGTVTSSQFTNLLGVIGHYGGLPLAGVFLGSTTSFNASLNSSDLRILDTVTLRAGNGADASFRAGTRYPIETGIYSSSGASSSLTAAAAGLSINGTSVSSLLSQYLGSSSVSVPQIQYEDLGITLKATPHVLRTNGVNMKLDLKIEALGSGTVNTLPILNNRALTSQVTIPEGQTALIASLVTRNEQRSIAGLPFLSELPGFQGTDKTKEVDTTELLITLTPHVVRNRRVEVASRRLLMPQGGTREGGGGDFAEPNPPGSSSPPPAGANPPEGSNPPGSGNSPQGGNPPQGTRPPQGGVPPQ